jgi:hypothetical protein
MKWREDTLVPRQYFGTNWGNQIRSYVLNPYTKVKDLRTGVETLDAQVVLDGDLDAFMKEALALRVYRWGKNTTVVAEPSRSSHVRSQAAGAPR